MAIFDSEKKHFLTAYAHLVDPVEITQLPGVQVPIGFSSTATIPLTPPGFPPGNETTVAALKAAFPNGMNTAPSLAEQLLNAPFAGYTDPEEDAPYIWTPWSGNGDPAGPYPLDKIKFKRRTGGFLGIGGTTVTYYWLIDFVLAEGDSEDGPLDGDGEVVAPAVQAEFLKRKWVEGFECTNLGPGNAAGFTGIAYSRDASRHPGGIGMAIRGTTTVKSISTTIFDSGLVDPKSWERIYMRLRKAPAAAVEFWRCHGSPSAANGACISVTPDRRLTLTCINTAGTRSLVATSTIQIEEWNGTIQHDAWNKLDILIDYSTPKVRVYRQGELILEGGTGTIDVQTHHVSSEIGNSSAVANDLYVDLDDWVCTKLPTRDGVEQLNGKDWLAGTKVALVRPTQFSSNHNGAAWTGDFRALLQNDTAAGRSTPENVSSTALALLAVDTDAETVIDADRGSMGVVSFVVGAYSRRGAASGQLGYKLGSAAAVMTAIGQSPTLAGNSVLFSANTSTLAGERPEFPDITPLELRHEKGNSADAAGIMALFAQVEMIGTWGPEDFLATRVEQLGADIEDEGGDLAEIDTSPVPRGIGMHNAPYPRSQWAQEALAGPIAPYIVKGGTYVGNNTGQDLTFRAPVHFFFVRPVTGNTGGFIWLSPCLAAHKAFGEATNASISQFEEDPTFVESSGEDSQQQRYRIRIAGSDTQLNATGVTYQYIAVMDPGSRYMLNGAMSNKTTTAQTYRHINDDMVPDFAMFLGEGLNLTTTIRLWAKHKGQTNAGHLAGYSVGQVANAINMATAGQLAVTAAGAALAGGHHLIYSLWRKEDGNQDSGEPGVVNFGAYIGDGAASRTINLSPATPSPGRRPLFAMVFAEAAQNCYHRDPSHTGTNSSTQTGTENGTGITSGGIDQFSVGATLNANGVQYVYFVLYADSDACNNGWGCNDEYVPVEPAPPIGGPWPDDPPDDGLSDAPQDEPTADTDEPDMENETELAPGRNVWGQLGGQVCEVYTRKQVNLALKRIGVSKQIANLVTDNTEEAAIARGFILEDVNTTLRDFDWPWATAYADLVLVSGSEADPVNDDWTYAYRAPDAMIKARRIVGQAGQKRAYDTNPIKFRLGVDSLGPLIFTNEAASDDVPLVLEYTVRLTCPAFYGDPLFRDALAWKFAHSFAMPLAKDSKKQEWCFSMYQAALANAAPVSANESQPDPDGDASWISARES